MVPSISSAMMPFISDKYTQIVKSGIHESMKMIVKFLLCFLLVTAFAVGAETPSEPTTTEVPQEFDRFYGQFFKMMSILILIVLFLACVTWFLKRTLNSRLQKMGSDSLIQIVDRRILTPRTTIYVLSVLGKTVVLAETHHGVTPLNEFSGPPPASFSHWMGENSSKH